VSNEKTHYRKAFNSPYLSSADIIGPTVLTIAKVMLQADQTKKSKDEFNTAYFKEKFLRPGELLKPMILNAQNSKIMKELADSPFIDDWQDITVTIYVDHNVKFGRETVEGLRISPQRPATTKPVVTPDNKKIWDSAINAYKRDGNFKAILEKADMSPEHQQMIIDECAA
jgi:hypothetical protein